MKPTSPIESPKSLFTQPQGFKGLQVPKSSPVSMHIDLSSYFLECYQKSGSQL